MAPKTQLRERQVKRFDELWRPLDDGPPLIVSFHLAEVDGCVRCVGYAVRTYLAVTVTGAVSYDAWAPLPIDPSTEAGTDVMFALHHHDEDAALEAGAHLALGEPFQINATQAKRVPFGHLLSLAVRRYVEKSRTFREWVQDTPKLADLSAWAEDFRLPEEVDAVQAPRRATDLSVIARRYEAFCRAGSSSPTRDVADALNMSRSTVAKKIMKCREAGLLATTSRGRAGGLLDETQGDTR